MWPVNIDVFVLNL